MVKVETADTFDAIKKEKWNALLDSCKARYIFQTYEFQRTWWRHFGEGNKRRRLLLLLARSEGRLIGIAPLMAEETPFLRYPVIKFIGTPIADYMDFIIPHERVDIGEAFYDYLKRQKCVEIDLMFIPENAASLIGAKALIRQVDACPYINLNTPWERFEAALDKPLKQDIARCERNILKDGGIDFGFAASAEEGEGLLQKYFDMHVRRWRDHGGKYSQFQHAFWRDFIRELTSELLPRQSVDISYIKTGNDIMAFHFGFIYDARFYYYMPTYNPDYSRFSPSRLLILNLIKRSYGLGLKEFDFLRGEEPYKMLWTSAVRPLYNSLVYPDEKMLKIEGMALRKIKDFYSSHVKNRLKKISPLMKVWYKAKGSAS